MTFSWRFYYSTVSLKSVKMLSEVKNFIASRCSFIVSWRRAIVVVLNSHQVGSIMLVSSLSLSLFLFYWGNPFLFSYNLTFIASFIATNRTLWRTIVKTLISADFTCIFTCYSHFIFLRSIGLFVFIAKKQRKVSTACQRGNDLGNVLGGFPRAC